MSYQKFLIGFTYRKMFIERFGLAEGLILEAVAQLRDCGYEQAEQYQRALGIDAETFGRAWRSLYIDGLIRFNGCEWECDDERVLAIFNASEVHANG